MKEIFYHNNIAYKVLRKIKSIDCDPKTYGIDKKDDESRMNMLSVWRDWVGADHVLAVRDGFYLCETIKEAILIE
jgi:hypothetical protein